MAGAPAIQDAGKQALGLSGSFDVSRQLTDAFSNSNMLDQGKFNTNMKTSGAAGGQRDPNEGTILTQIEEERTEETMGQQKLMDMFNDL